MSLLILSQRNKGRCITDILDTDYYNNELYQHKSAFQNLVTKLRGDVLELLDASIQNTSIPYLLNNALWNDDGRSCWFNTSLLQLMSMHHIMQVLCEYHMSCIRDKVEVILPCQNQKQQKKKILTPKNYSDVTVYNLVNLYTMTKFGFSTSTITENYVTNFENNTSIMQWVFDRNHYSQVAFDSKRKQHYIELHKETSLWPKETPAEKRKSKKPTYDALEFLLDEWIAKKMKTLLESVFNTIVVYTAGIDTKGGEVSLNYYVGKQMSTLVSTNTDEVFTMCYGEPETETTMTLNHDLQTVEMYFDREPIYLIFDVVMTGTRTMVTPGT